MDNRTDANPSKNGSARQLCIGAGFVDPMGFHAPLPSFSWKLPEGTKAQTAYRIEVRSGGEVAWDSGWTESDRTTFVPYGGEPFRSRQRCSWRVRFRDESGAESEWSAPARFEMGLLASSDWKAEWIGTAENPDPGTEPVAWLRREFPVAGKIARARLHVTARGLFEVRLNGEKVGSDFLVPGWTSYKKRIDTLTYDVTGGLRPGDNAIGALLGTGWYAGRLLWEGKRNFYGGEPSLLLQLEIDYADGSSETLVSDGHWKATANGPIRSSSIYDGEAYDAHLEMPGWDLPGFDDAGWSPVGTAFEPCAARLSPKPFKPVRATQRLPARKITEPKPGCFVFDLGQNMVGWARLEIPVEAGRVVTVRFAEMLNADGTPYTENYRSAKSTDTYIPAADGRVAWEPTFTFHGFRYVELSGLPEGTRPEKDMLEGVVLHSEFPATGTFESSHAKLNQLRSNIVWGQRGNFVDIPTDCPQRDERLGWTGDIQVFCPVAIFNFDCLAFLKSWLGSMRDDQFEDGRIPHVVPDVLGGGDSPGWMDAATFVPWELYVRTGDTGVLAENFQMMERLGRFYRSIARDGIILEPPTDKIGGFGDWLQPYAPDLKGETPLPLLLTAYYARSAQILADSAQALGKSAEQEQYASEAAEIATAFGEYFFDTDGKLKNAPETQTAYLLAIAFGIVPEGLREKAARHLVRLVHAAGDHLRTGFLGTPYIARVLDETGHADLAYKVLFQETYPSWFYSINQGATTVWERWNSYSHEEGFGEVSMNSFNHYAYGAINQWMVERVAGLAPDPAHPGYKHFFIQPMPGGPLEWARAELDTPYGKASSGWKKKDGKIVLDAIVPPNTTATVLFPDGRESQTLGPGTHRLELDT